MIFNVDSSYARLTEVYRCFVLWPRVARLHFVPAARCHTKVGATGGVELRVPRCVSMLPQMSRHLCSILSFGSFGLLEGLGSDGQPEDDIRFEALEIRPMLGGIW